MASIRQRSGNWYAEVRRKGYAPENKTFKTKAAAAAWARSVETQMDHGTWIDTSGQHLTAINDIIDHLVAYYARFDLNFSRSKISNLNQMSTWWSGVSIHDLTVDDVLEVAAYRRQTVKPSTLREQLYYLKQAVDVSRVQVAEKTVDLAIRELVRLRQISESVRRDRRPEDWELEALYKEAGNHWIGPAIDLAINTAMRQGEIHALRWSDVKWDRGVIHLNRKDKMVEGGKSAQQIPILGRVRDALLRSQNYFGKGDVLFPVKHASSISDRFARMCKKLDIKDLRFHDLRHEAISRLFEDGFKIEEVRLVSGHRTFSELSRYVNLRPVDLAGR